MNHFDETFLWDILMRHFVENFFMRNFDETVDETYWSNISWDILMTHFDETFWWDILLRHFYKTYWCNFLNVLMRQFMKYFNWTIWWNILMGHFDETVCYTFWLDILMRNFENNFWWLVIYLLNFTTGLSYLTQRVCCECLGLVLWLVALFLIVRNKQLRKHWGGRRWISGLLNQLQWCFYSSPWLCQGLLTIASTSKLKHQK